MPTPMPIMAATCAVKPGVVKKPSDDPDGGGRDADAEAARSRWADPSRRRNRRRRAAQP